MIGTNPLLSILPAAESDREAIAQLAADVFAASYGAMIPPDILADHLQIHYSGESIYRQLCDPLVTYWCAWHKGQLVGFCKVVECESHPSITLQRPLELAKLYVAATHHGNGVAAALMAVAERVAKERGFDGLWLCVWKENPRAVAFYRKWGFEAVVWTIIDVDGIAFDDAVMQKRIDP